MNPLAYLWIVIVADKINFSTFCLSDASTFILSSIMSAFWRNSISILILSSCSLARSSLYRSTELVSWDTFLEGLLRWDGGEGSTGFGFNVLWPAPAGVPFPTFYYGPEFIGCKLLAEVVCVGRLGGIFLLLLSVIALTSEKLSWKLFLIRWLLLPRGYLVCFI